LLGKGVPVEDGDEKLSGKTVVSTVDDADGLRFRCLTCSSWKFRNIFTKFRFKVEAFGFRSFFPAFGAFTLIFGSSLRFFRVDEAILKWSGFMTICLRSPGSLIYYLIILPVYVYKP
jgi:hypothetical protein